MRVPFKIEEMTGESRAVILLPRLCPLYPAFLERNVRRLNHPIIGLPETMCYVGLGACLEYLGPGLDNYNGVLVTRHILNGSSLLF